MALLAGAAFALDNTEVGHRIGQRAGDDIQSPVKLFLVEVRQHVMKDHNELAQYVAIVVGQKSAQAIVVFGVGARQHAHEGAAATAIQRQLQRRPDESVERVFERGVRTLFDLSQRSLAARVKVVEAAAEHFLDQVFLGSEVIVHGGQVDIGGGGHLAQRRAGKAVAGEQRLRGAENALFGGKLGSVHGSRHSIKRPFEGYERCAVWSNGLRAAHGGLAAGLENVNNP